MNLSDTHTTTPAKNPPPPSPKPPRGPKLRVLLLVGAMMGLAAGLGYWVAPYINDLTKDEIATAKRVLERMTKEKHLDQPTAIKVIDLLDLAAEERTPKAADEIATAKRVLERLTKEKHLDQPTATKVIDLLDLATEERTPKADYYTCGMHPWVLEPKPGDCPICHMKLTPLDPSKFTGEIVIDPVVVQNIGVRIAPVTTGPLTRTIRTIGTIDYNETTVRDVNIKVPGWIEKLHVDFLGEQVKKGQPLFELYSPQLYAAQEEYLLAWRNHDKIGADFVPGAAKAAKELLDSARTRLEYFDITDTQIDALQKRNKVTKTMTIFSPHSGVVIDKHANEGMKVDQGMRVYRIADLSKVWVLVTLYEYQLPFVKVGQKATMTLSYIPGKKIEGTVIYIYPTLEKKTREVQIRLEFDNPTLLLKPGMFANVELQSTLAKERTLIPRESVIDTGQRQVAFVSLGEGKFEPRNVTMGIETANGMIEIRDGLKPGEMVVTSGQFLIDSEAKLRETLAKMIRGDLASDQKVAVAVEGESDLKTLPDDAAKQLALILDGSFAVGETLASDKTDGITANAKQIADAVNQLIKINIPENEHFWHQHKEVATIRGKALELTQTTVIAEAREKFADLNIALAKLLKATGIPPSYNKEVQELHCPMFRDGQGGSTWLQVAGDVRNPFYGSKMIDCFDKRTALPVTGQKTVGDSQKQTPSPKNKKLMENGEHQEHAMVSSADQQQIDLMVKAYLAIGDMLTNDQYEKANAPLKQITETAKALTKSDTKSVVEVAKNIATVSAIKASDIKTFRSGFDQLSQAVLTLVRIAPPSAQAFPALYHAYCPMLKKDWLQAAQEIRNPYATYMLDCGTIKGRLDMSQKD